MWLAPRAKLGLVMCSWFDDAGGTVAEDVNHHS